MGTAGLSEDSFNKAALALGCEVAAIKAVCEVEAPRGGFLEDGRVRILFERHKFYKYTSGKFASSHPDICNPQPGGYGPDGAYQYERFNKAFSLDPQAAMMSASWGKFQIMGFNFRAAGFSSLDDFVSAMKLGEGAQLLAFVNVVKSWRLEDALRHHDWASFARQYNGENYRINSYDTKLAAAYDRHKKDQTLAGIAPAAAGRDGAATPPQSPATVNRAVEAHSQESSRVLKRGDTGQRVVDLQNALVHVGYATVKDVDGIFGPRTEVRVEVFQQDHSLPQTGVVDQATWDTLNRLIKQKG